MLVLVRLLAIPRNKEGRKTRKVKPMVLTERFVSVSELCFSKMLRTL